MSTLLTTAGPHNPTPLRAAVRRLFTLASRSQNPSAGGMFDRAQNTQIQNATFTINQYGGIVADHPHAVSVAAVGQQPREDAMAAFPRQEYDPSPRESPDVYVDHLLTKNRGYPLWIPSLSTTLPTLNRTLGVSLGDVGMLTPEGGFDFLFNILHDATHPINAVAGVPEGFVPFRQTKGSGHVEFVEWNAGSYLTSPSMVRVDDGSDRLKTILQNRHRETAVLMIPEETRAVRMHVTMPLRKYIEENIAVWYKFVKHTLGREVENGDLRVVYSCRKSSGFGIATAFNTDQREKTQLTFSVDSTWADISGCPYRWSHTGTAEVKAGPSRQENYDISSTEPVRNQCLFVSTIDTKVSAEIWRHIEELGIGIATEAESRPTSDTVPMQDSFTQSPTAETETHGAPNLPASHQYNERVFHPSAILHDILETIAPGLPVYMVCDDDWADSVKAKNIPVRAFVKLILEQRGSMVEHQGMAYFGRGGNQHIQDEILDEPITITRITCLGLTGSHYKATRIKHPFESTDPMRGSPSFSWLDTDPPEWQTKSAWDPDTSEPIGSTYGTDPLRINTPKWGTKAAPNPEKEKRPPSEPTSNEHRTESEVVDPPRSHT